jgi:hypothetical protein
MAQRLAILAAFVAFSFVAFSGWKVPWPRLPWNNCNDPWCFHDHAQYLAPGPEFKLAKEAVAMQAAAAESSAATADPQ